MGENTNGKNYVLGKGRVYVDLFAAGTNNTTGERYLGNTPAFGHTQSQDSLDHIDADQGLNVKDESIIIKNDLSLSFECDNVTQENIAMWFGGDVSNMTIAAAEGVINNDIIAIRGRTYTLGMDADTPMGTRNVDNVTIQKVTPGALPADPPTLTDVTLAGNVDVDLERARVYVEIDAPNIANGDVLRITYDQKAVTREIVIAKGQQVTGAVRFLADNPHGKNRDYYYPKVKITSNGDYTLKGDEWQKMSFSGEVLKKDASTERLYIDGVAASA